MEKQIEFRGFLTVIRVYMLSCAVPLGLWRKMDFKYQKLSLIMVVITSSFSIFLFILTLYTDANIYVSLDLDLILYKYSHDFTSNAFSLYSFYPILWCFFVFHREEWRKLYEIFSYNLKQTSRISTIAKVFLCACPLKLALEITDLVIQYQWKRKKFLKAIKYDYLILFRQIFKISVNWNKFVLAFLILSGLNILRSHLRTLERMVDNIRKENLKYGGSCSLYKLVNNKHIEKLKLVVDYYRMLCDGVTCFNSIFAKSLFLFTTATSLIMVTTLHCLLTKSSYSLYRNVFFISSPTADTVILVFIILICDHLREENSKFLHSCWKLQELQVFYYRSEIPILRRLIKETKKNKIRISVGGFFWIDKSLILRILSAVTTYLILLLQMKIPYD